MGAGVLGDLHNQRETLDRSRSRLKDVEAGLSQSNTIIKTMIFRAQQNKVVLLAVSLAILLVVIFGVYKLFAG